MSAMAADPPPSVGRTLTAFATAPFTRRARAELLYLVVAAPTGIAVPVGALAFVILMGFLAPGPAKPENVSFAGVAAGALVLLILATRLARRLGSFQRRLAARLLGERVAEPPPFRPGRGVLGRLDPRLRDGAGWRAVAYLLLRVPVAVLGLYAVEYWVTGLVNLSYPLWWGLFRNHPPDVHAESGPVPDPASDQSVPHHHVPRDASRLRRGRGVAAGRALGDQGGRAGGPVADPQPARPRQARAAGPRPGADPGPGGRRFRRAAAPARTRPARRRAGPAGRARDEPRPGQGEARRRRRPSSPRSASWSTPPTRAPRTPSSSCATWPGASTRRYSTPVCPTRWPASPPAAPSRSR